MLAIASEQRQRLCNGARCYPAVADVLLGIAERVPHGLRVGEQTNVCVNHLVVLVNCRRCRKLVTKSTHPLVSPPREMSASKYLGPRLKRDHNPMAGQGIAPLADRVPLPRNDFWRCDKQSAIDVSIEERDLHVVP